MASFVFRFPLTKSEVAYGKFFVFVLALTHAGISENTYGEFSLLDLPLTLPGS